MMIIGAMGAIGHDAFALHTHDKYDHAHISHDFYPILNVKTGEITFAFDRPVNTKLALDKVSLWTPGYAFPTLSGAQVHSDDGITFVISLTDEQLQDILSRSNLINSKLFVDQYATMDADDVFNKLTMLLIQIVGSSEYQQNYVSDDTAPVLALVGNSSITIEFGSHYHDKGATCTDDKAGVFAVLASDPVNVESRGHYTVTYRCIDNAGNTADVITRSVYVEGPGDVSTVDSVTATAIGPDHFTISWPSIQSMNFYEIITVTDNSEIHDTATVIETSYTVTGLSPDSMYWILVIGYPYTPLNDAPLGVRTLLSGNTTADTTPPVIALAGQSTVAISTGDSYADAGATCTDDRDGSLQPTVNGSVDTNTLGTYTLTYQCTDSAGNAAQPVNRTVAVRALPDTTPPVIALAGPIHSCDIDRRLVC